MTSSRLAYGVRYTDTQDVQRQVDLAEAAQQGPPAPAAREPDYAALVQVRPLPARDKVTLGRAHA